MFTVGMVVGMVVWGGREGMVGWRVIKAPSPSEWDVINASSLVVGVLILSCFLALSVRIVFGWGVIKAPAPLLGV